MAKTQPATAVSVLIAIIALFMILYILLLPPADRAELLNLSVEDKEDAGFRGAEGTSRESRGSEVILSEKPGEVSLDLDDENVRKLNSVGLFVKSQAESIDLINALSVSRSSFSNKFQELAFDLDDLDDIEELNLIFFVERADGKLFIDLNGNNILNIDVEEGKLRSVKLPTRFLERSNVVKFYTSAPGFIFLANIYDLSDVSLRKQFKLSNIKSQRRVSLSATELDNLDKATLNYVLYCEEISKREGRLNININNFLIHSDIVRCGQGFSSIEVDEEFLDEGDNVVEFSIDKGDYTLEQLELITELKGGALLTYDFFFEDEEFDDIWDGKKEAELKLVFGSAGEKSARFEINGKSIRMKTDDNDFSRDISGLVKEGNNIIKIIPDDEFVIDLMEIVLE